MEGQTAAATRLRWASASATWCGDQPPCLREVAGLGGGEDRHLLQQRAALVAGLDQQRNGVGLAMVGAAQRELVRRVGVPGVRGDLPEQFVRVGLRDLTIRSPDRSGSSLTVDREGGPLMIR
jgi:hypothetical protein